MGIVSKDVTTLKTVALPLSYTGFYSIYKSLLNTVVNDVELIYEAYEQVISESRPFRLPAGLKELANRMFFDIKTSFDSKVKTLRQRITPEDFINKDGFFIDEEVNVIIFKDTYDIKEFQKEFSFKKRDINVNAYIVVADKAVIRGGDADVEANTINIYIPLYNYDFSYLRKIIIHELAHLYDPHLLYSDGMYGVDTGLKQAGDYNYSTTDVSSYYSGTGYRSGKIPLEFNPKVVEIIDIHSKAEIKRFLKTLNINALDHSFHNFLNEIEKNNYLKRKFLEKLYNYAYSVDEPIEVTSGSIIVYDSNIGRLTTQHEMSDIESQWNDTDIVARYAELEMDAVYREFTDYRAFKRAVKQYIASSNRQSYKNAIPYIKLFDRLKNDPGIYKLIAQDDHEMLMFGKEIY